MKRYGIRMLDSSDFPFNVVYQNIPAGTEFAPHEHDFIELIYVSHGKGVHRMFRSSQPIGKGDVFIIHPGVAHAYQAASEGRLSLWYVRFCPRLLKNEMNDLMQSTPFFDFFLVEPFLRENMNYQSHLSLSDEEQITCTFFLNRLNDEYVQKAANYQILIKLQLTELLVCLGRWYDGRACPTFAGIKTGSGKMGTVCKFISRHYTQPLKLKQLCDLCGMSRSQFTAAFKAYTGMTFVAYRNTLRIKAAKELLETTDKKIVTIAQEVGFEDVSNFNKTFKKTEGHSPKEYRDARVLQH